MPRARANRLLSLRNLARFWCLGGPHPVHRAYNRSTGRCDAAPLVDDGVAARGVPLQRVLRLCCGRHNENPERANEGVIE